MQIGLLSLPKYGRKGVLENWCAQNVLQRFKRKYAKKQVSTGGHSSTHDRRHSWPPPHLMLSYVPLLVFCRRLVTLGNEQLGYDIGTGE